MTPTTTARRWALRDYTRPVTLNGERKMSRWERAEFVRQTRADFAVLARAQRIPRLRAVAVTAVPHLRDHNRQDVAGCLPSVKAAIDGLRDAGVLDDDGPDHVRAVTFLPPVCGDTDGLELIVAEVEA